MAETLSLVNNNTIIFTIARMNPPTPGHLLLIQKLIEEAIKQKVPKVYVILSRTNDNNENPINCPEKINILSEHADTANNMVSGLKNQMKRELEGQENESIILENTKSKIDQIEVIFICVSSEQSSPIIPLYDIVENYSRIPELNLFMIVGDDRADFLDTMADSFLFKNPDNFNSVNGQILAREDMDEFKRLSHEQLSRINISEVPISAFSASFVRKLVKLGMKGKFDDVYTPYLRPDQIDRLYGLISKGLQKPEPKSTSSSSAVAVNPLKYEYPIIKGIGRFDEYYEKYLENERIKEERKRVREEEKIRKEEEKRIKEEKKRKTEEVTVKPIKSAKAKTVVKQGAEAELGGSRSKRRKTRKSRKTKRRSRKTKRRKSRKHKKSKRRHYR